MGSTKHEPNISDLNKPYEQNVIGMRGIFGFATGLFLLIVVTFGLMRAFFNVLEENAKETKSSANPLQMSDKEQLPPEPRLQIAPGFGVESDHGKVNMELGAPQAEYRELKKQWDEIREHGRTDAKSGMIVSMSIEQAIEKLLEQKVKAKSGPDAEKAAAESRKYISDASSGRVASATRR